MLRRFSQFIKSKMATGTNTAYATSAKSVTSNIAKFLINIANFDNKTDEEIYELIYCYDSTVGAGVDRISALVRQSFKGFTLDKVGETLEPNEERVLELANEIREEVELDDLIEAESELLMMHGNIFILNKDKSYSYTILPNKYCSFVESPSQVNNFTINTMITEPNYLAFNEKREFEDQSGTKIYPAEEIIHIKYKHTPLFIKDVMGRDSFGVYSLSPLNRTITAVWWKLQVQIIDVLLRYSNLPRQHHKLDAELFHLANYSGNPEERRIEASKKIAETVEAYRNNVSMIAPDDNYITTSNVQIDMVESRNRNITPTAGNVILDQLDTTIMAGLNVPQSIVSGNTGGSYASELVISNYVASKVLHLSKKLKPHILELVKERIRRIDKSLPVDSLNITLELQLDAQKINIFREAAIMASLGVFTDDEIRLHIPGYTELTDEQRENIVNSVSNDITQIMRVPDQDDPSYPDSPNSDQQHTRDAGQNAYKNL